MTDARRRAGLIVARSGSRPRVTLGIPQRQMDQLPPAETVLHLLTTLQRLPGIHYRESRMTSPVEKGLYLKDHEALGPSSAFIDDHEYCYIHDNGALHLTLPREFQAEVIKSGWAELHPTAAAEIIPPTLTLIYAPRDVQEVDAVVEFVKVSQKFAAGTWV